MGLFPYRSWFCTLLLPLLPGVSKHNHKRDLAFEKFRPTFTHEAIYKLMQLGHIKHIISQNTDGLHRLSGVARDKISELHGNSYVEKCEKCGARYERPYAVRRVKSGKVTPRICVHCHFDHRTGRQCERKVMGWDVVACHLKESSYWSYFALYKD